jgi:hypothetical protein
MHKDSIIQVRWDLVAVVLAAVVCLAAPASIDPDLWGHVRFGKDMLRDGIICETDAYSYVTEGSRWINHEWLSEISFAWIYDHFRGLGLSALRLVIVLATTALLMAHLMARGLNAIRSGIIVIAVYYGMSIGIHLIRPQLFTYLFFSLLLVLICLIDKGRPMLIYAVPLIIALWANFHGGFLAGMGILGIWLTVDLGHRCLRARSVRALTEKRSLILISGGILSICASMATPYGWHLIEFLMSTATGPRLEIQDWQSLSLFSLAGAWYFAFLLACIWAIYRGRVASPAHLVAWTVAACLPFFAIRHLPLFALASGFLLAQSFAKAWNEAAPASRSSAEAKPGRLRLTIHLAVSAFLFVAAVPRLIAGIRVDPDVMLFPVRAVSLLKQSRVQGNLAPYFNWGEFVIWELGPRVKVSIDGRRETVYSSEIYAQNLALHFGTGEWDAILTKHPTDMVLAPHRTPMYAHMLGAKDWSLVYEDKLCGLFVRNNYKEKLILEHTPVPNVPIDGQGMHFE